MTIPPQPNRCDSVRSMTRAPRLLFIVTLASIGILARWMAEGDTLEIVVPGDLASVEGNINNDFPFNIGALNIPSLRYQQVYAASEFSALLPNGGYITHVSFRVDGTRDPFSSTLPDIQFNLSTTPKAVDGLSPTFAENVGADDTVVYGRATLSLSGTAGFSPNPFDVTIPLQAPFFYKPAAGNLLLDIRNYAGGITKPFDASSNVADGMSRQSTGLGGNVDALVADSPQSSASWGLVTQFTVQGAGAICGSALRRGRRGTHRLESRQSETRLSM